MRLVVTAPDRFPDGADPDMPLSDGRPVRVVIDGEGWEILAGGVEVPLRGAITATILDEPDTEDVLASSLQSGDSFSFSFGA